VRADQLEPLLELGLLFQEKLLGVLVADHALVRDGEQCGALTRGHLVPALVVETVEEG
jgi:hypothetical protein